MAGRAGGGLKQGQFGCAHRDKLGSSRQCCVQLRCGPRKHICPRFLSMRPAEKCRRTSPHCVYSSIPTSNCGRSPFARSSKMLNKSTLALLAVVTLLPNTLAGLQCNLQTHESNIVNIEVFSAPDLLDRSLDDPDWSQVILTGEFYFLFRSALLSCGLLF